MTMDNLVAMMKSDLKARVSVGRASARQQKEIPVGQQRP
jgi:hypothetical protein